MKNYRTILALSFAMASLCSACKKGKTETKEEEKKEVVIDWSEKDIAIVEMESNAKASTWNKASATLNGQNIEYIYAGSASLNSPGTKQLEYKVKIGLAGTYRFLWHCKVGEGTVPTEENDTWLKIEGAQSFYAENPKDKHVVLPHGKCTLGSDPATDNCPTGAGSGGWFKVYSNNTTDWTWRAKTNDKVAYEIYARFDKPGLYSVFVSARSAHHFINRFVMYHVDKYTESQATNLSLAPTD